MVTTRISTKTTIRPCCQHLEHILTQLSARGQWSQDSEPLASRGWPTGDAFKDRTASNIREGAGPVSGGESNVKIQVVPIGLSSFDLGVTKCVREYPLLASWLSNHEGLGVHIPLRKLFALDQRVH